MKFCEWKTKTQSRLPKFKSQYRTLKNLILSFNGNSISNLKAKLRKIFINYFY